MPLVRVHAVYMSDLDGLYRPKDANILENGIWPLCLRVQPHSVLMCVPFGILMRIALRCYCLDCSTARGAWLVQQQSTNPTLLAHEQAGKKSPWTN